LSCRSPERFSRCLVTCPEDAGIGLAPARAARAASDRSRPAGRSSAAPVRSCDAPATGHPPGEGAAAALLVGTGLVKVRSSDFKPGCPRAKPTGGEQAAYPLQSDNTSRHATTANAMVRGGIEALRLVRRWRCLRSHGRSRWFGPNHAHGSRGAAGSCALQADRWAMWSRSVPGTPFNSTGPTSVNATGPPSAASTTSWLTSTSPGRA
jgi:hypothetical protein